MILARPITARANDNRIAAGILTGSVLRVSLEARIALWYPDGNGVPAIPIQTFSEMGKRPQIPGPLIRARAGTLVIATVHNAIPGSILSMHGMVNRPTDRDRSVRIPFGSTQVVRFRLSATGTYLYWGSTRAANFAKRFRADSQLNGAIVVDPPGFKAVLRDRIFVISQWINVTHKNGSPNFNYELNAINGHAWPHTESLSMNRGESVHWRWLNASHGSHPMHLHGYYFTVDSRGDGLADTIYKKDSDRDHVVTELVKPGNTFTLTWQADRPGNWLFHCHLTYHTLGHLPIAAMLAGKETMPEDRYESEFVRHAGMGGLILGFTVHDRKQRTAARPTPLQHFHLRVQPAADDRSDAPSFRYVLGSDRVNESAAIGPPVILTRGVPTAIEVTNMLHEPTAVHWHGIELADSYYDGVMGISGYGKRVAPMIESGQTFQVRMTPPRAGTFIYHTHMDDVWQLRAGLAGPLIVLEPGTTFDPVSDHVFTITTTHKLSDVLKIFVNGEFSPPPITCRAGVLQRFRFINVTTFWTEAVVSLSAGGRAAKWSPLQIDGAYVPAVQRVPESAVQSITIGETRDFTFRPRAPGELQLQFWPDASVPNIVTIPVHVI
ncbi:MAG: multicopper oxidase domain-containing protein [Candidatus Eremiobacteraeota bacterium]|nr:multicopper oxidase domain-containing protein [Candidatus Eremiobacteraeota bacterium]